MPRKAKLPDGMTKRGKVYHADFTTRGRRIRKRLSTDLSVAKQMLNELKVEADRADFGLRDNNHSIERLKEDYLTYCRQVLKQSTVERYERCFARILPGLGVQRVNQVQPKGIYAYRDSRSAEGKSPRTVNAEVGALSTMLRWAVENDMIATNPIEAVKPLPHDNPKQGRPLETWEVRELLKASPDHWRDIWYCFLVTGLRKNELAELRFSDVDWDGKELHVRRGIAKNHCERHIPINEELYAILSRQESGRADRQPGKGKTPKITARVRERFTSEHVFVTTQNTPLSHSSGLYHAFMRCCREAGIETRTLDGDGNELSHVDLHSLRRTFATDLISNGADPKTAQELLGHKTLAMTMQVYARIRKDTKRQALNRLSYGSETLAPEGIVDYTDTVSEAGTFGHKSVTTPDQDQDPSTQTLAG